MSYKLNKTDGELLVELADGQIDNTTTDITLVGRNYKGFGEFINENFIKMVENFAATAAPGNPLIGQLWYDTSEERLKIYNGNTFRSAGGPIVSASQPAMVAGDIWIDNENNKMYFFDGTDLVLVGPDYDNAQGQTGFEVASVIDISARERVVLKIWVGGVLFGVIAKEEFLLSGDNKIGGYPDFEDDVVIPPRQLIKRGINLVDETNAWYQGTAANARALVDAEGNSFSSADFLPTTEDGETSGRITVKNANGISVGIDDTQYVALKIEGTTSVLETQQKGADLSLRTRPGNSPVSAVTIKTSNQRIGLFNDDPLYEVDITGSLRASGNAIIEGDLTVNGNATYVNVANIQVEDKNIELNVSDGVVASDDAGLDGAGILLKSTDSDKTILWDNANSAIDISENVNLPVGKEYKINDQLVLSRTELGPTVAIASGITRVGTLTELDVDYLTLDGNTISTSPGFDLTIDADGGNISVSTAKITDLVDPVDAQDAATKNYVDVQIASEPLVLTLDITGLTAPTAINPYTDVAAILEDLYPAASKENGTQARVHCTSYTSVSVTGLDIDGAANKSYLSVLTDDSSAQSVVQDISFDPVTGTATLTPTRSLMTFVVSAGAWDWQNTV